MSLSNVRLPMRNRTGAQRPGRNGDENAGTKHTRQSSGIAIAGSRLAGGISKSGPQRPALGEVTTLAVNRNKDTGAKLNGKEKANVDAALKKKPSLVGPQRVPVSSTATRNRQSASRLSRTSFLPSAKRTSQSVSQEPASTVMVPVKEEEVVQIEEEAEVGMDVEADQLVHFDEPEPEPEASLLVGEQEVEAMVGLSDDEAENIEAEDTAKIPTCSAKPKRVWPEVSTERKQKYKREVDAIREVFEDEVDVFDTTMVSEYSEDIFEYMCELEESVMPSANYMDLQNEITWQMRQTLVDWLLQVHLRYHMLPETLWIAVNIVDRFLTKRVVSLVKLQLVGVTAMFIAAKYEEILAPSVDEFVFMTENGYSKEEILKGERIVLQTLEFKISHYCSPYSWMRKISKADDYDIQTRTLSKFLTEVTLLDWQFLRCKPSLVAAVGMFTARKMLGGDWGNAFVFFSGYTEEQLLPGHQLLVEKLGEENFGKQYVCKKYANKKFLKASLFAIEWARTNLEPAIGSEGEGMMTE